MGMFSWHAQDDDAYPPAARALYAEIKALEYLNVASWNDRQTDRRVVVRALRRTARKLLGAKR